jgi:hypothetical protein
LRGCPIPEKEAGFQSTNLGGILCFPDLRQDFGFSADRAEDCAEFARGYLKTLMTVPRYDKNCGGYDFFSDNFEEGGCEQEYLQKFLEAALLYFSQRVNKCRVDYLENFVRYSLQLDNQNSLSYLLWRVQRVISDFVKNACFCVNSMIKLRKR